MANTNFLNYFLVEFSVFIFFMYFKAQALKKFVFYL